MMKENFSIEKFVNPDAKHKGVPFWAWNGKLNKDELIRQVHIFKEMGFGGFFMHSRSGLITEYMGDEWMEYIKEVSIEAEKIGLKAWLYDEDRWPSGTVGGIVTKNPEFRMKFISLKEFDVSTFNTSFCKDTLLSSFAVKFNSNGVLEDYYKIDSALGIKSGFKVAVFFVETMQQDDFYNGNTYLDTLNIDATNEFIRLTHEKYKSAAGELFGKQLLGIFTDEPHRGCAFGGFGINNENKAKMTPYTYKLFNEFSSINGYDLLDKLPELFYETKNNFSKVSHDYIETLQRLFLNNFAKPYHNWCSENKLLVTGHVLHEDSLCNQAAISGSVMRYYEYMDYPGIDVLQENNSPYWAVKQVSSVAKQLDKPFVLSELYGCTGWQFNFENHKNVGDWQAFLGVNIRCHHLSWYTMLGQAKRDYPASIFFQSGWHDKYSFVENYFSRLGFALSCGEALTDTLVISPIESVWGYVRMGSINGLWQTNSEINAIDSDYISQFNALCSAGVDFDYADEDILSRYYKIENGTFSVGKMKYKTILISGVQSIRNSTLKILNELETQNVKIIVKDNFKYVNGIKERIVISCAEQAHSFKEAAEKCRENSNIKIETKENDLFFSLRKYNEETYCFAILNKDRNNGKIGASVSINIPFETLEMNMRDGKFYSCDYEVLNDKTIISLDFEKGEEHVFLLTRNKEFLLQTNTKEKIGNYKIASLPNKLEYKLNEPNALVLDMPNYFIDGRPCGKDEILRIDKKLREEFNLPTRGGETIQPWFKNKFFASKQDKKFVAVKLAYSFNISKEYLEQKEDMFFVCETPEKFNFSLNNAPITNRTCGEFIDNSMKKIAIDSALLKVGKNTLEIDFEFKESIELESCYIIGNFSVFLASDGLATLSSLPNTLDERSLAEQGLPFYSGKITLFTKINNGNAELTFSKVRGAYAEVDFGKIKETIAFAPYKTTIQKIENELTFSICLTRRNLFGPLHLSNPIASAYGPFSFADKSDDYTNEYKFYDEGIDFPTIKLQSNNLLKKSRTRSYNICN